MASPRSLQSAPDAETLARGIRRLMADLGFAGIEEFRLANGRRADLAGIDSRGRIMLVEIKSCLADFRADTKWPDYLAHCDFFYFGVSADFPRRLLEAPEAWPAHTGLIVADGFSGAILREARPLDLPSARRRAALVRFARTAAARLACHEPRPD